MKIFQFGSIFYLMALIWTITPIYASDLNYNFESNASGIFKIQSMMLIDEMPAQFNGMVNISGDVDYNGLINIADIVIIVLCILLIKIQINDKSAVNNTIGILSPSTPKKY